VVNLFLLLQPQPSYISKQPSEIFFSLDYKATK